VAGVACRAAGSSGRRAGDAGQDSAAAYGRPRAGGATDSARSCDSASTMTRTSDSVPEGRSSTRPVLAQLGLRGADRVGDLRRGADA